MDCFNHHNISWINTSTLNPRNINQLQGYVDHFIRLLARSDPESQVQEYEFIDVIQDIGMVTYGRYFPIDQLSKIITAYQTVYQISTLPVTLFESNGEVQTPVISSLSRMLLRTLDENYHQVRRPCKSYNETSKRCTLGNPLIVEINENGEKSVSRDHMFTCDFHMYDSLSIHLVLASLYNTMWAINKNYDKDMIMMGCFLGLYHDIGKPASVETYEFKNSAITGFPAHGEVGAMIFQAHWSESMRSYISQDNYMTITTSILHHMCGYHGGSRERGNQYKRTLLLIDPPMVRTMLTINRVGDHFGKLTADHVDTVDHSFLEEQKIFETQMNNPVFNLTNCLTKYTNKNGAINPTKIVIYCIGASGSGKTHFCTEFVKQFQSTTIVSRDEVIAEVCVGIRQRLEGDDYTNMYKIYNQGKQLESLLQQNKKQSNGKKNNHPNKQLVLAREQFIDAKKSWNQYVEENKKPYPLVKEDNAEDCTENIQTQVRDLYESRILDGINDANRFLILDTFMNCFPRGVEANVPKILTNYFRVHVHVQSFLESTSSSICSTVEKQIKISGPHGIETPIHPEGFQSNKKAFASLGAEIATEGPLPKSTFKSSFRPHLVAGICMRTNEGSTGYKETFRCIDKLLL
jgi:hypothetical protein